MRKKFLVTLTTVIIVLIVLVVFLLRGGDESAEVEPVLIPIGTSMTAHAALPMTAAPTENPNMTIDAAYGLALQYPVEYAGILVHEQEVHNELITEIFSMRNGDADIPLFRIDFGNETAGDWLGILKIDDRIIHITYTVFALAENELNAMSEIVQEQYFVLMNSFNNILDSIAADPRFSYEKPLAIGADTEVVTTYWTLTLPSNMFVTETRENDNYVAVFYGDVVGEQIALYKVCIGNNKAETELGLFEVNGVKKPISVGSFDIADKPSWNEDDYSAAYRMMDTINDVIQVIMESKQFSADAGQ